jgi:hypothetical protein
MQDEEVNATKADMLHKNILMCNEYMQGFISRSKVSHIKDTYSSTNHAKIELKEEEMPEMVVQIFNSLSELITKFIPQNEEDDEMSWFGELVTEKTLSMIQMFWIVRVYETIELLQDQCLVNIFGSERRINQIFNSIVIN